MTKRSGFLLAAAGKTRTAVAPTQPNEASEQEGQPLGARADDLEYFQSRAEQEVASAQSAKDPAVVAAHYQLAERYLELVSRAQPPNELAEP